MIKFEYENVIVKGKLTNYLIDSIYEDYIIVSDCDSYGVIDYNGNIIIPLEYERISKFYNNVAYFKKNGKYGLIDISLNIILEPTYNRIKYLKNGYFIAYQYLGNSNYCIIDSSGKVLRKSIEFNNLQFTDNNIILCEFINHYNLLDKDFNELTITYEQLNYLFNGVIKCLKNVYKHNDVKRLYGIINEKGEEIFPTKYENISVIDENSLIVKEKNNRIKIVDYSGKLIRKLKIDFELGDFKDGVSICYQKRRYGLVNKDIQLITAIIYENICELDNGFYKVMRNNKYGIVDKSGNYIVSLKYNSIKVLENGNIALIKNKETTILSKDGDFIFSFNGKGIRSTSFGYALEKKRNSFYFDVILFDKMGNIILNKDNVHSVEIFDNYVIWKTDEGYNLTDIYGNIIIPCVNHKIYNAYNNRFIIDNKLIDLNEEYLKLDYKIRINYEDIVIERSFSTDKERRRYKKYFDIFISKEIDRLNERKKEIIAKIENDTSKSTNDLINYSIKKVKK